MCGCRVANMRASSLTTGGRGTPGAVGADVTIVPTSEALLASVDREDGGVGGSLFLTTSSYGGFAVI